MAYATIYHLAFRQFGLKNLSHGTYRSPKFCDAQIFNIYPQVIMPAIEKSTPKNKLWIFMREDSQRPSSKIQMPELKKTANSSLFPFYFS